MIDRAKWGTTTEWVWVLAAVFSALLLGAGAWIGATTGDWLALVLAVGLTAPLEILLFTRHRRRAAVHEPVDETFDSSHNGGNAS